MNLFCVCYTHWHFSHFLRWSGGSSVIPIKSCQTPSSLSCCCVSNVLMRCDSVIVLSVFLHTLSIRFYQFLIFSRNKMNYRKTEVRMFSIRKHFINLGTFFQMKHMLSCNFMLICINRQPDDWQTVKMNLTYVLGLKFYMALSYAALATNDGRWFVSTLVSWVQQWSKECKNDSNLEREKNPLSIEQF